MCVIVVVVRLTDDGLVPLREETRCVIASNTQKEKGRREKEKPKHTNINTPPVITHTLTHLPPGTFTDF